MFPRNKVKRDFNFLILLFIILINLHCEVSTADVVFANCSPESLSKNKLPLKLKKLKEVAPPEFLSIFTKMKKVKMPIEGLSLEELKAKILNIDIYILPSTETVRGKGHFGIRLEASHGPNCILASESLFENIQINEFFPNLYLLFHEALGALGYNDRDFEITSYLMLPDSLLSKIKPPELNRLRETVILADGGEGGGSVVGGGGDTLLLTLKSQLLNLVSSGRIYDDKLQKVTLDEEVKNAFLQFVLNLKLDYTFDQMNVSDLGTIGEPFQSLIQSMSKPLSLKMLRMNKAVFLKNDDFQTYGFLSYDNWEMLQHLSSILLAKDSDVLKLDVIPDSQMHDLEKSMQRIVLQDVTQNPVIRNTLSVIFKGAKNDAEIQKELDELSPLVAADILIYIYTNLNQFKLFKIKLDTIEQTHFAALMILSDLYKDFILIQKWKQKQGIL